MSIRVLHVLTHLNIGGIPTYAYTLTKYLIRNGVEVAIASSGGPWEDDFKALGVKVFRIDIRTKSELSLKLWKSYFQLMKIKKEFDFNIIHSHTRVTQILSGVFSRINNVKHVGNFHGFYKQNKKRWGRKVFKAHGDMAIAITPDVKKDLVDVFGAKPEKVKAIVSAIDFERLDKNSERLNLEGTPKIGTSGRLSSVKGFDNLIKAMPDIVSKHSNAKLYILGEGKEEDSLLALINSLNLKDSVIVLKRQPLASFLKALDLFCLPSIEEPLGLSVLEAQYFGIPCVVSDIGGLRILVDGKNTGLLSKVGDCDELSKNINLLLDDKELRSRISDNSKAQVKKNFDLTNKVFDFIDVYKEVLNENTSVSP